MARRRVEGRITAKRPPLGSVGARSHVLPCNLVSGPAPLLRSKPSRLPAAPSGEQSDSGWRLAREAPSLAEAHRTIPVPIIASRWRKALAFPAPLASCSGRCSATHCAEPRSWLFSSTRTSGRAPANVPHTARPDIATRRPGRLATVHAYDAADPYHYYRIEPCHAHDLVIFGGPITESPRGSSAPCRG